MLFSQDSNETCTRACSQRDSGCSGRPTEGRAQVLQPGSINLGLQAYFSTKRLWVVTTATSFRVNPLVTWTLKFASSIMTTDPWPRCGWGVYVTVNSGIPSYLIFIWHCKSALRFPLPSVLCCSLWLVLGVLLSLLCIPHAFPSLFGAANFSHSFRLRYIHIDMDCSCIPPKTLLPSTEDIDTDTHFYT